MSKKIDSKLNYSRSRVSTAQTPGNPIKSTLKPFQKAMASGSGQDVRRAMEAVFAPDAKLQLFHPIGELNGPEAYWSQCIEPLFTAMPDLERRDMIVLSGTTKEGEDWVGTMGNYMGTFSKQFMGIPPTPGPMSGDGLFASGDGSATMSHVLDMLTDLCRHPANPDPAVMQLEKYWHPAFNWYGPAGIGTSRGISGFRNWHQIPFLNAMPDRRLDAVADLMSHWFAEGDYVCETGWPNMRLTLTDDGWMGIAPVDKEVCLRSLDFWRMEDGLIRENWVLVDLLDVYAQVGINVLGRMEEFNKARLY